MSDTYWNGEPANAAQGHGTVNGEDMRVVRVFYAGGQFDLNDSTGSAWRKVTNGFGSPRYGHRNVEVEPGTFVPDDWGPIIAEGVKRMEATDG